VTAPYIKILFLCCDITFPLTMLFLNYSFRHEVRMIIRRLFQCDCCIRTGLVKKCVVSERNAYVPSPADSWS
jgi:hypothetical protein